MTRTLTDSATQKVLMNLQKKQHGSAIAFMERSGLTKDIEYIPAS